MGKPGPKQVPVTAKIQKSTVGGIVQPSLPGMGSMAKMKKAPIGRSRSGYKGITKKETPKSNSGYTNMTFAEYRKSGLMKPEEAKFYKGSGTKRVKIDNKNGIKDYHGGDVAKLGPQSNKKATSNPYVGTGLGLGKGAAGVGAKLATGNSGSSKKVTSNTNAGNAKSVRGGFFGTDDYKKAVSAGNKEANSDNARRDFTANLKNQSKPKAKAVKAVKAKSVKSVAKPKAEIKTKLAATTAKPTAKPTKKQVRKAKSVERKTARAAKTRRKSIEALESGNLAKAKRLKRRETRINKRIEKKKSGQASKAIEPK